MLGSLQNMASVVPRPTVVRKLWLSWKAIRFPWRKQFLCGADLSGNTFWEFKLTRDKDERTRRIVKYTYDVQHSDVKLSPSWIQWLRHTRIAPPSIEEQEQDIVRQEQIKLLAAKADARWAAQTSYLLPPDQQASLGADLDRMAKQALPQQSEDHTVEVLSEGPGSTAKPVAKPNPYKQASKTKDEPEAWSPKTIKR